MLYQEFKAFSCYILECFILDKAFLLGLSRILLVIIFDGRKESHLLAVLSLLQCLFHFGKFEGPREVIMESLFSAFTFY